MKYTITLLSLFAVLFFLTSACGGSDKTEDETEQAIKQLENDPYAEIEHGKLSKNCGESVERYEKLVEKWGELMKKKQQGEDTTAEEEELQKEGEELSKKIQSEMLSHQDTDCAIAFRNASAKMAQYMMEIMQMPSATE